MHIRFYNFFNMFSVSVSFRFPVTTTVMSTSLSPVCCRWAVFTSSCPTCTVWPGSWASTPPPRLQALTSMEDTHTLCKTTLSKPPAGKGSVKHEQVDECHQCRSLSMAFISEFICCTVVIVSELFFYCK